MENLPDVRVGVIGCGDNLLRKILDSVDKVDGIKIVAVADVYGSLKETLEFLANRRNDDGSPMYSGELRDNINRLARMEEEGKIKYFSINDRNFEADFFSEVDAVHVSTPNEWHAHYAIMAAKHKMHILCEKPFVETYNDAVNTNFEIRKAKGESDITLIGDVHYLMYGPSQEFLKHMNNELDDLIKSIRAEFIEDKSYLNERTRVQFSRKGAIHDMLVHYVALLHKMGANFTFENCDIRRYIYPNYINETAVTSNTGIEGGEGGQGGHYALGCKAELITAKGREYNSKKIIIKLQNKREITLNFLAGERGISDSSGKVWWDKDRINVDPFSEIYGEFRDNVLNRMHGYGNSVRIHHTLEDSRRDLLVLDKIRDYSQLRNYLEFYQNNRSA